MKRRRTRSAPPGWALAENNTEDDWKDVTISFVAGNPMSYVMDFTRPTTSSAGRCRSRAYKTWPWTGSSVSTGSCKRGAEAAVAEAKGHKVPRQVYVKPNYVRMKPATMPQAMDQALAAPASPRAGGSAVEKRADKPLGELLAGSYDSEAQGAKIGDLFSYEPKEKVSISRGQAAMVPILSKQISGRRLLYYKASFAPRATNAFVVQNATDLTLEAGAVTFYEGSTSLGEGILSHTLPPGSQEVIPYALDASVDVTHRKKLTERRISRPAL